MSFADNAGPPRLVVPSGACDCHMHFFGPPDRYPLGPNSPYQPPLATVAQYRRVMQLLGLERVVVVQPVSYATDNSCTMDAVAELGDAARAVVLVTPDTTEAEIARLHAAGARGARFFLLNGAVVRWDMLEAVAARIAGFGWHIQLQFDGRDICEHADLISRLPCPVVFDHNGKFLEPVAASHPAVDALLRLLDTGRCWVKVSAPYETSRSGAPDYADVAPIARRLIHAAPERCVWASNWPHGAERHKPDDAVLLDLLLDWAPDDAVRQRILSENPATLYDFA